MTDKKFLTSHEAATELDVRRPQVLNLISSGQLKAIDVSVDPKSKRPSWRIPREALDEFIANRVNKIAAGKPQRARKTSTARFYA